MSTALPTAVTPTATPQTSASGRQPFDDAQHVLAAADLIRLGARMQLLEQEFPVSRDRLIRLYREIVGNSPPKGMLPFSVEWFMTWRPNIHGSLFYNTFLFLRGEAHCTRLNALSKAFTLYREHCILAGEPVTLDLTRAWTLVRFFEADMVRLSACTRCGARFVAFAHDPQHGYVCSLCKPPSRAGKGKKETHRSTYGLAAAAEEQITGLRANSPLQ